MRERLTAPLLVLAVLTVQVVVTADLLRHALTAARTQHRAFPELLVGELRTARPVTCNHRHTHLYTKVVYCTYLTPPAHRHLYTKVTSRYGKILATTGTQTPVHKGDLTIR